MALSSFVPALSSPPPCTVAMLNRPGSLSSASSSSPSCSVRFTCSFSQPPLTVAFMPFLRPTSLCYSRRSSQIVRMAPEEEKKTQRSPLDFPILSRGSSETNPSTSTRNGKDPSPDEDQISFLNSVP
ncbi:hypothetical protein AABB24_007246 [Solanum stoloniferum]|uniref:Uncharacterized protein n=1 Tax=Solanum stoloniferum TaxID=62892 RepID=A0ABD2UP18_9SOLN